MSNNEKNRMHHIGFGSQELLNNDSMHLVEDNIAMAIFDSMDEMPLHYYPTRIEAAVMAIILKGKVKLTINLQEFIIEAHHLILLMPNQIVQVIEKSDDFAGVYIAISPEAVNDVTLGVQSNLNTFLYAQENPVTAVSEEEEAVLMEYHTFIWKQIKKNNNVYMRRISNYLILSLVLEIMDIVNKHRPLRISSKTRKEELFERFLKEIGEHYQENRLVAYYADRMCITAKYLSSLCKTLTGVTASEWIDRCVILEAKTLLKNSTYTIQEVSERLNFPNQSFFGKYFKHHIGCSPKDYRAGKGNQKE